MVFWLLAIAITVVACAALYYAAAGRAVNAPAAGGDTPLDSHFRLQLKEIEGDLATGRLPPAEGIAAKAELAREVIRQQKEAASHAAPAIDAAGPVLPLSILLVALLAFATYAFLGRPDLPSEPVAGRTDVAAQNITLPDAIKTVETRLAANPSDLRGWQVIAPIYMQSGDYQKAEHAFRQILALAPATADADTDLAEALMMQGNGAPNAEAMDLLNKAAALDPRHIRSRFYLAAASTRAGDYAKAVGQWNDIIALGTDSDNWMATAKQGLAAAEAGRDGKPLPAAPAAGAAASAAQSPAIVGMVQGLADRLSKNGGPLADWTQLVKSEIVLGDLTKAQAAYDSARKAYPDAGERAELDGLAAQAGLKIDGSAP